MIDFLRKIFEDLENYLNFSSREVEIEQSTEILQSIETFQSFGITHGTKWSTCAGTRMLLVNSYLNISESKKLKIFEKNQKF